MPTKFFKESNHWVVQKDAAVRERIVTPGHFILEEKNSYLSIVGSSTDIDVLFRNVLVTDIVKDRIDTPYTDVAEFILTNESFF